MTPPRCVAWVGGLPPPWYEPGVLIDARGMASASPEISTVNILPKSLRRLRNETSRHPNRIRTSLLFFPSILYVVAVAVHPGKWRVRHRWSLADGANSKFSRIAPYAWPFDISKSSLLLSCFSSFPSWQPVAILGIFLITPVPVHFCCILNSLWE